MHIVINHLTRMQKGFICVAGIDLQIQRHVRPVLGSQLRSELLAAHGGPFALRSIVDLGTTHFVGSVPEIEDRQLSSEQVRVLGEMPDAEFRQLLDAVAEEELSKLFGPELENTSTTCAIPAQRGLRSLASQLYVKRRYWTILEKLTTNIYLLVRRTPPVTSI